MTLSFNVTVTFLVSTGRLYITLEKYFVMALTIPNKHLFFSYTLSSVFQLNEFQNCLFSSLFVLNRHILKLLIKTMMIYHIVYDYYNLGTLITRSYGTCMLQYRTFCVHITVE